MSMTVTKTRSTAPTEAPALLDINTLEHLHGHPAIAPLLARQHALRTRLQEINDRVVQLRRALHGLQDEEGFAGLSTRRKVTTELSTLEEDGAAVETELTAVNAELVVMKEQVKTQLTRPLAQEGMQVTAALLAALEQLETAGEAYKAFGQRSFRLVEGHLAPMQFDFGLLPTMIRRAQEILARLQANV